MASSVALANYTLSESDDLRKAIGKKIIEKIEKHKIKFIDGCCSNQKFIDGCEDRNPRELATDIYSQIYTFARYGFNKSHAVAYAVLAYQSMWLKTYYPEFFMASVLTSYIGAKLEEIIPYLNETRKLGIKLLPPDVNHSTMKFEVSKDRKGIHFGLTGIKGVGQKAVEEILAVRSKHPFRVLSDFIALTGSAVNKTVVGALAKAGAFDTFGQTRSTMVKASEDIIAINAGIKKKIASNKKRKHPVSDISSFYNPLQEYIPEELPEFTLDEICKMERELTGFYISHHPLEGLIDYIQGKTTHSSTVINKGYFMGTDDSLTDEDEIEDLYTPLPKGQTVITGGLVKEVKELTIKKGRNKGKKMASFTLEDAYQGDIKVTVFEGEYRRMANIIKDGSIIFIKGNIDYFNDTAQINATDIRLIKRDNARVERLKELIQERPIVEKQIADIEETIQLLGDDEGLIVDITNELFRLYGKLDEINKEMKDVEFAS